MDNKEKELIKAPEHEMLEMINDTSQLFANEKANYLSSVATAVHESNELSSNVEFWKWMNRNYSASEIFSSSESMQNYIAQGSGKEEWVIKQLQGKGYEWDWMMNQRADIANAMNTYDAGDVANRAASDVTVKNLFTGETCEFQMKAYTGKANPHLKNTPKEMAVVTNAEKAKIVKANGYKNVESFQDSKVIKQSTSDRLEQIKNGKAYTAYNLQNVVGTMAKSGGIALVIGMGTEAIFSYKEWKAGRLSDKEYITGILKSGGDASVTAGVTAGIMIPVSATITAVGVSSLMTIPVAIVLGGAVNKVVAPCFGRGEYREILAKSKYYQSLNGIYDDLMESMIKSSEEYYNFIDGVYKQNLMHQELRKKSAALSNDLKKLCDSI